MKSGNFWKKIELEISYLCKYLKNSDLKLNVLKMNEIEKTKAIHTTE